jgi:signal transduction histidine kinase
MDRSPVVLVAEPRPRGGLPGLCTLLEDQAGVDLEAVHDARACRARLARGGVALLVVDLRLADEAQRILAGLAGGGPPVVAVLEGPAEARALEAFRGRSAECVARGPELAVSLAAAVRGRLRRAGAAAVPAEPASAPAPGSRDALRGEIEQLQRQVLQAEKLASIGRLAAGVAHEINNPMGFIHANLAQLAEYAADLGRLWEAVGRLRKAVAAQDAAEVRTAAADLDALDAELDAGFLLVDLAKAVRESQEGSERIRHIVQDLRAFSHGSEEAARTDLNQCLDSTANIAWATLKHSVQLERDYGEIPLVTCRPRQLQQVFMNLLVNAAQAIEARRRAEGGSAPGRIRLATRRTPEGVVVEVSDTGVGIPPEHRERIFEPFFTTKEVGEGTGLGLSTSWDIVHRHGGRLRLRGEPGGGSCFEVHLPLDGGEPA